MFGPLAALLVADVLIEDAADVDDDADDRDGFEHESAGLRGDLLKVGFAGLLSGSDLAGGSFTSAAFDRVGFVVLAGQVVDDSRSGFFVGPLIIGTASGLAVIHVGLACRDPIHGVEWFVF